MHDKLSFIAIASTLGVLLVPACDDKAVGPSAPAAAAGSINQVSPLGTGKVDPQKLQKIEPVQSADVLKAGPVVGGTRECAGGEASCAGDPVCGNKLNALVTSPTTSPTSPTPTTATTAQPLPTEPIIAPTGSPTLAPQPNPIPIPAPTTAITPPAP